MSATSVVRERHWRAAPTGAWLSGALALAVAAGLSVWAVAAAGRASRLSAWLAALALGLLVTGVVSGFGRLVGPGLGVLMLAFAMSLAGAGPEVRVDLAGAGVLLLVVGELALWSIERRGPARAGHDLLRRRALELIATLFGCLAAGGALTLLAVDPPARPGPGVSAAGVLAVLALTALIVILSRRALTR
jgi:hypothetical protein